MKTPTTKRPYSINYLEGFWFKLFRDIMLSVRRAFPGRPQIKALVRKHLYHLSFKRAVSHFPRKVKIEWVIISFLLALLLSGARARIIPESLNLPPTPRVIKQLPEPHIEPVSALEPVAVPEPVITPVVAYTAPVSSGAVDCGSDPMMAYIYTVESGCRTWAYNPDNCRGLGQACPGGKLPCGDYDWACQDAWFRNYAVATYGSIYNAYIYRQSHNYW